MDELSSARGMCGFAAGAGGVDEAEGLGRGAGDFDSGVGIFDVEVLGGGVELGCTGFAVAFDCVVVGNGLIAFVDVPATGVLVVESVFTFSSIFEELAVGVAFFSVSFTSFCILVAELLEATVPFSGKALTCSKIFDFPGFAGAVAIVEAGLAAVLEAGSVVAGLVAIFATGFLTGSGFATDFAGFVAAFVDFARVVGAFTASANPVSTGSATTFLGLPFVLTTSEDIACDQLARKMCAGGGVVEEKFQQA